MIEDAYQDIVATPSVTLGLPDGICFGYDLNPDFGTGQYARKAPAVSQTDGWYLKCRVAVPFTAGTGTPFLQVHAVLSTTGEFGVTSVNDPSADYVAIGSALAPRHTDTGVEHWGFSAAQLALDTTFYIALNPWSNAYGYDLAGAALDHKDLRYLGLVLFTSNYVTDNFTGGAVGARLVRQSDIAHNPTDFIYPSGTRIVG